MSSDIDIEEIELVNKLKAIVTAITNKTDIPIVFTHEDTSKTDFKNIFISFNNLPLDFKVVNEDLIKALKLPFYQKILNGIVAHEAGHILLTLPLNKYYKNLKNKTEGFSEHLLNAIINIFEDKRVNTFIIRRYRLDLGKQLELALKEIGKSQFEGLKDHYNKGYKPYEIEDIINYVILKGLYGIEPNFLFNDPKDIELKKDAERIIEVLEQNKSTFIYVKLISAINEVISILKKYPLPYYVVNIPYQYGGDVLPKLNEDQKKQIEKEKEVIVFTHAGKKLCRGLGNEVASPKPNILRYTYILSNVKKEIEELLRYLKVTKAFDFDKISYADKGQLMHNIISKVYPSSFKYPIINIYNKNVVKEKEKPIYICVIIDFSGSVNLMNALEALTVLGEACSKWLRDSEFAILTFGDRYLKIKAFYERWENVKYRVGGMKDLGGTEPVEPILKAIELMKGLTDRKRVIVTVSDFKFEEDQINRLKEIVKNNRDITFINICLGYGYIEVAKEISKFTAKINGIKDLPKKFFEVYRQLF